LNIFKIIVDSKEPPTLESLAKTTDADSVLLGRIMRGLCAIHAVEDVGEEKYAPTKLTRAFASRKGISGINML
jgi:hypothetical protein